jgi:Sulfotransferase domain
MTLRVVGAGLGRTATQSLQLALQQLLGGPCYHMIELFEHPEHVPMWHAAVRGEPIDW